MKVEPYLFFNGRCREALDFYRQALDAEVTVLMRYRDSPEPPAPGSIPPGAEDKVMHASFRVGASTLMASDGNCQGALAFDGFGLAITARDAAEANRWFDALAAGGQVRMPLARTFFSPSFGMLADKFGVGWMVLAEH